MKLAYTFYDRPNYTAGPRINALRILPEFARRGLEVHAIIGYQRACPAADILRKQNVTVHEIAWPYYCEDQVDAFQRTLSRIDPDVFVPNICVPGGYLGRFLREAGCPTILGHLSDDRFNWGVAERFCRAGDEYAASGLFCMGRELGDQVRNWNPARTTVVDIPHGVPIPGSTATSSGNLRLVYAGRMEDQQKRISDLADAVIRAMRRHRDAEAMFIGDGSQLESVKQRFHNAGINHRVHFTGYVDPEHVQEKMRWGNALVLLSDYEGIPGAVMDAMAVGLVPVCLDIPGGLRELVIPGETGLMVRDRHDDFLCAIERLASNDRLRASLAEQSRQHVKNEFSLDVCVNKWLCFFEQLRAAAQPRTAIRFPEFRWIPDPYAAFGEEDVRKTWSSRLQRSLVHLRAGISNSIAEIRGSIPAPSRFT